MDTQLPNYQQPPPITPSTPPVQSPKTHHTRAALILAMSVVALAAAAYIYLSPAMVETNVEQMVSQATTAQPVPPTPPFDFQNNAIISMQVRYRGNLTEIRGDPESGIELFTDFSSGDEPRFLIPDVNKVTVERYGPDLEAPARIEDLKPGQRITIIVYYVRNEDDPSSWIREVRGIRIHPYGELEERP